MFPAAFAAHKHLVGDRGGDHAWAHARHTNNPRSSWV